MPALYAHNKFGKLVIPKLPDEIKNIIKKYPDSFRIGLQGPDFLFFDITKRKITGLGVHMHHCDTYSFMEHALTVIQQYGLDSPQFSYITGFICHFTLDNICHPYVNRFMKETNCGHVEIEGDLDHLILSGDGHSPERYPLNLLVPASRDTAAGMAPFYPQLTIDEIYHSLCMMQYIKRLFVAPGKIKRALFILLMKATFHYKRLKGHAMTPYPNPKCRAQSIFLYDRLVHSVEEAVMLVHNFTNSALKGTILSGKFHRDFNGNYMYE